MKKLQIYTSPTCHYCHLAKDFFASNGLAYEEFDVMADVPKRQEMIEKSGQMGVPVIVVDDQVMVGFDEGHLKSVLGI
jgi:glutaredoxin-like YruB-family protein